MVAHRLVQLGEVVEADGRVAVLGTQQRLTDRERSLVQRQRIRIKHVMRIRRSHAASTTTLLVLDPRAA